LPSFLYRPRKDNGQGGSGTEVPETSCAEAVAQERQEGKKVMDLKEIQEEYKSLTDELSNPEVISDWEHFQEISKRRGYLEKIIKKQEELKDIKNKIEENKQILTGQEEPELMSLAEQELTTLQQKEQELEKGIEDLITNSGQQEAPKAVIMEIRPGTGGEEAALFASALLRMYTKYAVNQGWTQTVLHMQETELGGMKEIAIEFKGEDVFRKLQHEAGVHRVQRIPETEKAERVHTSTASVAVLAKPKKEQIAIKPDDLRIDVYRSSGKGGQNVNKRETAVRITHLPTGIMVASQTQRNQLQNKENALSILSARLLEKQQEESAASISGERRAQIGQAKRAEKIRTYNFPQDRITDHRIQKSWYGIEHIMAGNLDEITGALQESTS